MRLTFSPRALREAERCARWWLEHRPAAHHLFEQELREAVEFIRTTPSLGTSFTSRRSGREYRRALMIRTRHHVYYRVSGEDEVRVVAVWSAVRGRGPAL